MNQYNGRKRADLELHVFNLEITKDSYHYLKAAAKARGVSMAHYVDALLQRKLERARERAGLIQSEDSTG